uniref:ATP synthase F0 subunit 8 n=1 Tax=Pygmaeconus traillii TaxID=1917173 RepID=A0A1L3N1X8_9COND|nr:ATP synthase F0 subunit 8 [Pygmaeconus traillii]
MPQLSPLNWILLFILFWLAILLMSILIWWSKKIMLSTKILLAPKAWNKWNW